MPAKRMKTRHLRMKRCMLRMMAMATRGCFINHVSHMRWLKANDSTMAPPPPQKGLVERTGVAA